MLNHTRTPGGWRAVTEPDVRSFGGAEAVAAALAERKCECECECATTPIVAPGRGGLRSQTSGSDEPAEETRAIVVYGGSTASALPAYGVSGTAMLPVPAFRWSVGQRLDQTLLDVQAPLLHRVLRASPNRFSVLAAKGDRFLRCAAPLPTLPDVDVVIFGAWVQPDGAGGEDLLFSHRHTPGKIEFALCNPTPARVRELSLDYLCLADTGMRLLSPKAAQTLVVRLGELRDSSLTANAKPFGDWFDFLGIPDGTYGAAEGRRTTRELRVALVPLPQASVYPFRTSRQMIASLSAIQNVEADETKLGMLGARRHPDQYLQNADFRYPLRLEENHTLWVEGSSIPASWRLSSDHVLTGVPVNQWDLSLEQGVCLDFVPIGQDEYCVRFYGIDDRFTGTAGDTSSRWLGRPVANWFFGRNLSRGDLGAGDAVQLQEAALFPVHRLDELDPRYLEWLFRREPASSGGFAEKYGSARRLSARQLSDTANVTRAIESRNRLREGALRQLLGNSRFSVFLRLDLLSTAKLYAESSHSLPEATATPSQALDAMREVHESMFRSAVRRNRGEGGWQAGEEHAFALLRDLIVREAQLAPVDPRCNLIEDQILWGRSPVRLDLAGGWTDTPPYCLEHGGRVVNVAVDLNGQPPIQVFARLSDKPELVMRSIDLGAEHRIRTFEELDTYAQPGSEFAIAKAAFALTGFLPRFNARGGYGSLREQLENFGGGIEVSLLSAVPKGSGLGTSSILAATLLATLGELCGLGWDRQVWFSRTLALEQMLTTGGGWQDQAGGIYRGLKMIETSPGLAQKPTLRWLPDHLFSHDFANKSLLLYYTGLTRMAKNILHEIVRGIFLNSPVHLGLVEEIGANADTAFQAIQSLDYGALGASIRRSWELNQALDMGTNPPGVADVLRRIDDLCLGAKLLGAGGGGYLLIVAKDEEAAKRIRSKLTTRPPNPRARFVELSLSTSGLQITRS